MWRLLTATTQERGTCSVVFLVLALNSANVIAVPTIRVQHAGMIGHMFRAIMASFDGFMFPRRS